ncbi:MAG TPA: hypothetical protein DDX92_01805 [Flavobacteriales bacterium]|jgi:sugar transferase (PEP-CTERM/EpsH1 system associated)|nr:hypothetical protein [Flavobacteriales bacterium]
MRILVLLSRIPWPLEKGDKLRAYYQLQELSKCHEICLVCLTDRPPHPEAMEKLESFCTEVHFLRLSRFKILLSLVFGLFDSKPLQINYFYQTKTRKELDRIIQKWMPNHIFTQLVRTAEYLKKYSIFPITLDYMDAFSEGANRRISKTTFLLQPLFKLESKRLAKYEAEVFDIFKHKIIISKKDREHIHHIDRNEIHIVKNGVDLAAFSPDQLAKKTTDLLFTGNMNYPPNVSAAKRLAKEILPELSKSFPEIKLTIAGATPHATVKALENNQVIITGWVPKIQPIYSSARVFVAPMEIGSGMQNKILEAMAMEIPVVTSRLAAEPIGAKHNNELLVADSNEEFIQCIHSLLTDQNLRDEITQNAKNFVKEKFSWKSNTAKLLELIQNN